VLEIRVLEANVNSINGSAVSSYAVFRTSNCLNVLF